MDWREFLRAIEQSFVGVWVRENPSMLAFPTVIALHAIGMGFLVGANAVLALRMLGFAPRVPLSTLEGFFPVMRFGFWLNLVSGLMLLAAFPAKALTNGVFYLKLFLIAAALVETFQMRKHFLRNPRFDRGPIPLAGRMLAGSSLLIWAGAVTAGRLLAYTHSMLMVD
jgi:hypothetical protein